jgi:ribosomal biogenesis protein LAS1
VPLGVDITARLQEVRMRDSGAGQGMRQDISASAQHLMEAESLLRLQYAMLIIRLVNGISDSAQKGRIAMSVAHLAEDAGLPPGCPLRAFEKL